MTRGQRNEEALARGRRTGLAARAPRCHPSVAVFPWWPPRTGYALLEHGQRGARPVALVPQSAEPGPLGR